MRVLLLESPVRSGYKIVKVTHQDGARPTEKISTYYFKHSAGSGAVAIQHGKGLPSRIDFRVHKEPGYEPDVKNTVGILKTVEKVARLHLKQAKPKKVAFFATNDDHDRPGHNRRDAIYQRMAAKILRNRYKQDPQSSGQMQAKRVFTRVRGRK